VRLIDDRYGQAPQTAGDAGKSRVGVNEVDPGVVDQGRKVEPDANGVERSTAPAGLVNALGPLIERLLCGSAVTTDKHGLPDTEVDQSATELIDVGRDPCHVRLQNMEHVEFPLGSLTHPHLHIDRLGKCRAVT
jgi:hypothetical protein